MGPSIKEFSNIMGIKISLLIILEMAIIEINTGHIKGA